MDKKRFSRIALIMAISLFLSGCAGNIPFTDKEEKVSKETGYTVETLGLEPDFSYERQVEIPNVQVNRLGYLPESTKVAFFQGKELPESFQVIEKESGKCVYEGEVRRREGTAGDILTGYGNFTGIKAEGSYYIQCDKIGCSYYFDIGRTVYQETARGLIKVIEEMPEGTAQNGQAENEDEAVDVCAMISYLLVTYELYPELLAEIWEPAGTGSEMPEVVGEDFFRMIREGTDRLLALQDEKNGGIYKSMEARSLTEESGQSDNAKISDEATAAFAGTMAKYGYLYQQYDRDYANICLKAAAKAWRYLSSRQSGAERSVEDSISAGVSAATGMFYAASELYRASNEVTYHNYILQNQEWMLDQKEDIYLLMAKITYLSARRKVDPVLCGKMIGGLMESAERITAEAKEGLFLVDEEETDAVLWNMSVMALANYAIMNQEYVTVIEDHVHYLMGRNREAEFLAENPEGREAAGMLLLLSVIEAEQEIVEAAESEEE